MARKYCHKQESGLTFFLDFLMSLCNCHISGLGHFSEMCHSVSSGKGGWMGGGEPPHSLINFTGSIQTSGGSRISVGGVDLRRGHFSVKMYAKTKELGPIGGVRRARPLDPPMQTAISFQPHTLMIHKHDTATVSLFFTTQMHKPNNETCKKVIWNCLPKEFKGEVLNSSKSLVCLVC